MKVEGKRLNPEDALKLKPSSKQANKKISQDARSRAIPRNHKGDVEISALAKEINAMAKPLTESVRPDKVEHFKKAISSGQYRPDSKAVARKVIEDLML
ncbi:MAG: flagellar biosynthesis anti-sigma factor FlgM [Candidatus Dadabacteria bacterium]|nr:MAG: flagellar biosynthesis anti-sigma factor FlgM [Candidatus Dadabacteria bacterium]